MRAQQDRNAMVLSILGFLVLTFSDLLVYAMTGRGIPCPVRALTGYLCPGCGMTRALTALLKGDVVGALAFNPLSVTVLPVLGVYLLFRVLRTMYGDFEGFRTWELVFLLILLVVVVWFGVQRNLA